jgi:hypothetical protein
VKGDENDSPDKLVQCWHLGCHLLKHRISDLLPLYFL